MGYFYKRKPLDIYCAKNNISYQKILHRIKYLEKRFNDMDKEKIIEMALNDRVSSKYVKNEATKHFSDFRIYVEDENSLFSDSSDEITNSDIVRRTRFLKNKLNISDKKAEVIASDDRLYKDTLGSNHQKYYYYKGSTLRKYCKENKIDYIEIFKNICKLDEMSNNLEEQEIIELAIAISNKQYNEVLNKIQIKYQKALLLALKETLLKSEKEKVKTIEQLSSKKD